MGTVRVRVPRLLRHETEAYKQGFSLIGGVDEAGRGPLAGPVFAACCILPNGFFHREINDSKQLTPVKRARLYQSFRDNPEIIYAFAYAGVEEIDRINIFEASKLTMRKAVDQLSKKPDILFVDGFHLDGVSIPVKKIIGGDGLSLSIAAASIIAKVERDRYMEEIGRQCPGWGFEIHKGYGTKVHLENIKKWGPIPGVHRMTFEPIKSGFEENY